MGRLRNTLLSLRPVATRQGSAAMPHRVRLLFAWALLLTVLALACAPARPPSSTAPSPSGGGSEVPRAPAAPKRLTIALQNEPKALLTIMGGDAGGAPAAHLLLALHQTLAMYDDRGEPYPMLATELPSQTNGT